MCKEHRGPTAQMPDTGMYGKNEFKSLEALHCKLPQRFVRAARKAHHSLTPAAT